MLTIDTDYATNPELDVLATNTKTVVITKVLDDTNDGSKTVQDTFVITFKHSCRETTITAPDFVTDSYSYDLYISTPMPFTAPSESNA